MFSQDFNLDGVLLATSSDQKQGGQILGGAMGAMGVMASDILMCGPGKKKLVFEISYGNPASLGGNM